MGNPRAINWWMDGEMWYIHTTEYYPVIKRKEILTRDTKFMYLEVVMPSESSQTQKATCCMILLMWSCGFPWWLSSKVHLPMQETQVCSLGWEDLLVKEMATHSGIPAWKIPWTEEPGGLQSMGLQKSRMQLSN